MKRVLDGAVGEIISIQETYLASPLSFRPRQPNWSEMEYQMRNWQYFVWLSGDFNNEQHVHSLDKAAWAMRDEPPVRAWGIGGQQLRDPTQSATCTTITPSPTNIASGVHVHSYCRQIPGCPWDVNDIIFGTKGRASILAGRIDGEKKWRYKGPARSHMYEAEHERFFAAIRSGETINNGEYMVRSTMMAILGRLVDYTGQAITWEDMMTSQQKLVPARYAMTPRRRSCPARTASIRAECRA